MGQNGSGVMLAAAGRTLIAAVFVVAAVGLIGDFAGATALMTAKHVPQPAPLLVAAIVVWLIGAAGLLIASTRRYAALLLLAGTVVVTLVIHDFWAAPAAQLPNEMQHFLSNVAICGGLLGIAAK